MTKLCVCKICTCGRHKCPHKPQSTALNGPLSTSEYSNTYVPHPIERREPFKPAVNENTNTAPMGDQTTHRTDYVPHPVGERPRGRQAEPYMPPEQVLDSTTSYKQDYPEKFGERAQPMKRPEARKLSAKFSGEPTYKSDYRKWDTKPREKFGSKDRYEPSGDPFDGSTTNYRDYVDHGQQPVRSSMRPRETAISSDQPFDDRTEHRESYPKHLLPERYVREKPKWETNSAPLDGLTNYQKDYTPKDMAKTVSCKPDHVPVQSGAPLESDTTHRADYRLWPQEGRPQGRQQQPYVKPEGEMESATTSHTDYDRKPIERVVAIRPTARKRSAGKFDDATNYKDDYKPWAVNGTERHRAKNDYTAPTEPFGGIPTYQSDYVGHQAPVRQSLRPVERARASDQPFDGSTGYRDDYIRHSLPEKVRREPQQWSENPNKLDGLSSYMKDFTMKESGGKQASCKPDQGAYQSESPFVGDTTHRADFKLWPTERRLAREQDPYRKPEGEFDHQTTSHTDYTQKPLEKTGAIRPEHTKTVPGKFDGTTSYGEDYRKWAPGERPKQTAKAGYTPSEVPFEGRTNYQDDYTTRSMDPTRRSMKPVDRGFASNAPFDDNTEYRNEFTSKGIEVCQATRLHKDFELIEEDHHGHKFYAPLKSSTTTITQLKPPAGSRAVNGAGNTGYLPTIAVA